MQEEIVSSDVNKKIKKAEKIFYFVFSRIFMMTVFYSI
jgi:cell division protein FtsL